VLRRAALAPPGLLVVFVMVRQGLAFRRDLKIPWP
jgi:hypothetical protein